MTLRATFTASLILLAMEGPSTSSAQSDPSSWQAVTEFAGLDQSALSPPQKRELLDVLRGASCNCGCTMKVAECRVKDPKCARSRSLAAMAVKELHDGKSADAVRADLERRMNEAPPLLDEPVTIPIAGAPAKGAANAKITIVEFSDFQ